MKYNFPAVRFVRENNSCEQINHVLSEVDEITELGPVLDEATLAGDATRYDETRRKIVLECMDLYHALETLFRILEHEHGRDYVLQLWSDTEAKNRERGYYESANG